MGDHRRGNPARCPPPAGNLPGGYHGISPSRPMANYTRSRPPEDFQSTTDCLAPVRLEEASAATSKPLVRPASVAFAQDAVYIRDHNNGSRAEAGGSGKFIALVVGWDLQLDRLAAMHRRGDQDNHASITCSPLAVRGRGRNLNGHPVVGRFFVVSSWARTLL